MTIREAIGFVDEIFPNTFSNETKTRWLSQCDAEIWNDVMLLPAYAFPGYRWQSDADRPMLVPEAYEQLYVYWLSAQMHKAYQEIAEYSNDAQLYNALRTRFVIWYADTFDPAHGGVMPLPPVTTFRRGETATIIIGWLPYKPEDIATLLVMFRSENGASFDLQKSDLTFGTDYVSYTFTTAQSLALTPGIYDIAIGGTTTDGKRFETQVNLWKLSVLDTIMGGEAGNSGRGITSIAGQDDGTWLITYSDGATQIIDVSPSGSTRHPEKALLYYGYPSMITGDESVSSAVLVYCKYDVCVFGDQYELEDNEDHANTVAIFSQLKTTYPNVRLVGYVPIGVQNVAEDSNLTIAEIKSRIDKWRAMGADGIFLDEFGYDYGVSRERQNECVSYCHTNGMFVIANAWEIEDVFSTKQKYVEDLDFDGNPNRLAPQLGENDYYLFENLFLEIAHNYMEEILYDENDQMIVRTSVNWRIDTIYEYFNTSHTGETESWHEMYHTKLMSLDAIPSTAQDSLQSEMRSFCVLGATALGMDAIALGDETWGADSGYTDWEFPESINLGRDGDKEMIMNYKATRWYTFTYIGREVQFGTSGGIRVPSEVDGETIYTYYHSEFVEDGVWSCLLFGTRKTLYVEFGEEGEATITIDGVEYTAVTDPDADWEDEEFFLEFPYKWTAMIHGNAIAVVFDAQSPEDTHYSPDTHYVTINGYKVTNIWQTIFGLQSEFDAIAKDFEKTKSDLESGIDYIDDIKDELDATYSSLSEIIEGAEDAISAAAEELESALQAVEDVAEGFTFREAEW